MKETAVIVFLRKKLVKSNCPVLFSFFNHESLHSVSNNLEIKSAKYGSKIN